MTFTDANTEKDKYTWMHCGDPSVLTNYRQISNLSVLAKVKQSLLSVRLQEEAEYDNTTVTFHKGVPQGSILGSHLLIIYINELGKNVSDANLHFYADSAVIYCNGSTSTQAV